MENNADIAIDSLLRTANVNELLTYEREQRKLADACRRDAHHHQRQAEKARAEINRRKR